VKKLFLWIKAVFRALKYFLGPQDAIFRTSGKGFPLIRGWERLEENQVPYHALLTGVSLQKISPPVGAFVFAMGKDKGEVVYLHPGNFTLGTGCTNEIVVTSQVQTERKLLVRVSAHSVTLSSDAYDCPLIVNGQKVTDTVLVDQDECQFAEAIFYYQELRT
jgi:hypothetical protein